VDAIASKMGKYRDKDGQIYSHETGTSTQYAMSAIADACARAYIDGMTHEEVWQRAQRMCVEKALATSRKAMRDLGEDTPEGEGNRSTEILQYTSAALHMYALDRQMGVVTQEDETPINALFGTRIPRILKGIVKSQLAHTENCGIVAQDGEHEPVAVAEVIRRRPHEIRYEDWRYDMDQAHKCWEKYDDIPAISYTRTALYGINYEDDPEILEETCGRTLEFISMLYGDSESMAVATLPQMPERYLATLYKQDGEAKQRFEAILQLAYDTKEGFDSHTLWKLHNYFPGGLTGEAAKAHPVIEQLRARYKDDAELLCAALPNMPPVVDPEEVARYNSQMRSMMTDISHTIFPDAAFAQRYAEDMIRSFEPRHWTHDDDYDYHGYENRDGSRTMQAIMNKLRQSSRTNGAERLMALHERFNLGAIDVFSPRDVQVLDALDRGDPAEITAMREKDVTLVMFDAYGDHNNVVKSVTDQLNIRDSHHERILIPWCKPEDLNKTLAMLRRNGIKPCTIAIANHGDPGVMAFNKGAEGFQIVSDMSLANDPKMGLNRPYDLSHAQLETIARRFMSLPRYSASTREPRKQWILASCASDRKPEGEALSIAETGTRIINQADVSVIATEDYTSVMGGENSLGLHMFGNRTSVEEGKHNPEESNLVELRIDPTSEWIRIERRPIEERLSP